MLDVSRISQVGSLCPCRAWLALVPVFLGAALGCDSGPPVAPVSGVVLVDGEPLVGASVNTQPYGGKDVQSSVGSFARTNAKGEYTLRLVNPRIPGAIIGDHRVTITPEFYSQNSGRDYDVDDEDVPFTEIARPPPWPTKYVDGSLLLTVPPGGTDKADFDLKFKKP